MTERSVEPGGLYVHIPFCSAICPYCDFAVRKGSREERARYVECLLLEIDLAADREFPVRSIYFGGGTPSALCPAEIGAILARLRDRFAVDDGARVSLEANPEDVSVESLASWRALGIGTLSLGVQSFVDSELRFLGRRHSSDDAVRSVRSALASGFETVSIDLIFGLPDQSLDAWRRSLDSACELAPQHVSCYQLTIHEGTPFSRRREVRKLIELPEDAQAEHFLETHERLEAVGLSAYEVSNFARGDAHRSVHNQGYWEHAPYIGLGVSAHGFRAGERSWNEREVSHWEARLRAGDRPVAGRERLSAGQLALEALFLRLRRVAGIDLAAFREQYGVDLEERNRDLIARYVECGLVEDDAARLRLTRRGLAVADGIVRQLEVE